MTIDPKDITYPPRMRGWEISTLKLIVAELNKPFDWTTSNCGHLMAASIRGCHGGNHPALKELDAFTSEQTVKDIVTSAGGIDKILAKYFVELPSMLLAWQGDLVVVNSKEGQAGCVMLDGMVTGKSEKVSRSGSSAFRITRQSGTVAFRV